MSSSQVLHSPDARERISRALDWLAAREPSAEALIVGATAESTAESIRNAVLRLGNEASFGLHRASLGRLAAALAESALVTEGLAPLGRLGAEALVARVVHALRDSGSLGRYAEVADTPGFSRAAARTLDELRLAGLGAEALRSVAPELSLILEAYEAELARAGLADRARVFALAAEPDLDHPLLGHPTLFLDVAIESTAERNLVAAVAARAPEALFTVPAGDARTLEHLGSLPDSLPDVKREELSPAVVDSSLSRLQAHLFEDETPPESPLDASVTILSAPGESRECVEIARHISKLAAAGTPFDRMAILLRSPEEYRPHLEEALARADVPVHFARGAVRPDPAGRAFMALLACAAEGLSARRFSEYLSLGEVPDATAAGTPPAAPPASDRWVAPDEELVPERIAEALAEPLREADASADLADPDTAPTAAGTLRAPRRWETLLVDAAVIGGRERWERRLAGLEHELRLDLAEVEARDPDDPRADRLRRNLADLANLSGYALPLLDELAALPPATTRGTWGDWLEQLSRLASRALRGPERVQATLAELAPMAGVGPVGLDEVQLVLSQRLLELAVPPPASRYGRVFVAPCEAARGMGFDVVFVPGLAERLFPKKIAEEPILLDALRARLGHGLVTNESRVARERLALRLAVGAACERVVLSYPRLDLDQSRPRVPSFYTLEALRAAEGRLPGFDELASRAETLSQSRVGWPAPPRPEDAIDEAEHDLALLQGLLELDPEKSVGTARYLLTANPHLGRALRFRARRWIPRWGPADGLVEPSEAAREAIAKHALTARSFSPTALQNYASCPYRFFLQAVHRLAPREVPEAIEELDPLQRGSLVHEVQFELFGKLREAGLLPVTAAQLDAARALLDEVLDAVAARYRDDLAPAIDRVWEDGVSAVRADLREWLRRAAEDDSGFVPWRFELAFGLPGLAGRRGRDPESTEEAVALDCGIRLRGSIDLVERSADGRLRATDHKTGKERVKQGSVVEGGQSLQPVFYALVAEKLFADAAVDAGRLYYCTSTGGFAETTVPLDARARTSAQHVADVVGDALTQPFLPAAPAKGACRWCDYNVVCGPYEERRTAHKWQPALAALDGLRKLP